MCGEKNLQVSLWSELSAAALLVSTVTKSEGAAHLSYPAVNN